MSARKIEHPRALAAGLAVVVLGGLGVGFVLYRSHRAAEDRVQDMLRNVESELAADPFERTSATDVLRRLGKQIEQDPHVDLVRARARLLLAFGRPQDAWDDIVQLAMAPGAAVEDHQLGARISSALHAARGLSEDGTRALAFAEQHYRATGDVASLFLAWQMAYRTTRVKEWIDLHKELVAEFQGSREARLARTIALDLCYHLSHRLGLGGDQAAFGDLVDDGTPDAAALARQVLELRGSSPPVDLDTLRRIADDWPQPPAELEVLLASAEIMQETPESLHEAVYRLERGLDEYPAYLEARHAATIAYVGLGERATPRCTAQLRWLLRNAPKIDTRRPTWDALQR